MSILSKFYANLANLCQFYVKMPLRNMYFLKHWSPPPFEQCQKTARLVERDIPYDEDEDGQENL